MSSPWFAKALVFSAHAGVSEGDDADVPKGVHLRLMPSASIGLPLAPIGLWRVPALRMQPLEFAWSDRRGPVATPNLDAAGGELFGTLKSTLANDACLIGVELSPAGGAAGQAQLSVLDRLVEPRVFAERSRSRWLVSAPDIVRIRVRGRGMAAVHGWVVPADHAFERVIGSAPIATLSAPFLGEAPWYAGGEGPERALARVRDGAPLCLGASDRPDGPFDPLGPDDEAARVAAFSADLDAEFALMVGTPGTVPGAAEQVHTWLAADLSPGRRRPWQRVKFNVRDALLMKSIDPGAARYLGLMTRLDHTPDGFDAAGQPTASAWLAAGVFACGKLDPLRFPAPDAFEQRLLERLTLLTPGLRRVVERAVKNGLVPRVFVAPALATPLPDRPVAPTVSRGRATWVRADEGPSTAFSQRFLIERPAMAPLVALGRLAAGGWEPRNQIVESTQRAAVRVLGVPDGQASLYDGRSGIVDDTPVEAALVPWAYRVALGDLFGRFGAATDLGVPLPARPPLPAPALRSSVEPPAVAEHRELADSGRLRLQVLVPESDRLTAGSLPIATVRAEFDGTQLTQPAPAEGGTLEFEFTPPPLLPMQARRLEASAHFEDAEGGVGPSARVAVDIADPRAPLIPATGIGIVWSGRPGPSDEVEFKLHFAGAAGVRYRVYLADARGLEIATADGERPRTRAEIAVEGARLGLAGVAKRERFRLLTDTPLEPVAGRVLLQTRLPRSLETVQFLRFVPLSARGTEAKFSDCPLLPIAVPSERLPPAPRVQVEVDADSGVARVTVLALGLDLVGLRAAEPGLFEAPPDAAARSPQWRLRRASGAVPDALYAREVARGALAFDGAGFSAAIDDSPTATGLIPYVRWFYWADVRMPPERRLPPGVDEVPLPAGGIEPLQPAQREDAPGAPSAPSAPALAMYVPATVPGLTAAMCIASVAPNIGGANWVLTLSVAGGPVAHARAVGRYRMAVHLRIDGGDFAPTAPALAFENGEMAFTQTRAGNVPVIRLALVLTDPLGREGSPLFLDAEAV